MKAIRDYLCRRFNERSFWVGIGTACAAAAVLPAPWSYVSFAVGTIASLVPDGKIAGGSQ